jgi:hypothetical protein
MTPDKLDSIIAKARVLRNTHIDPVSFVLTDLIEALAIELKDHLGDSSHLRTIGGPPSGGIPLADKDLDFPVLGPPLGLTQQRIERAEPSFEGW